jgi:DNA-binding response OmpR family regulator
VQQAEPVPISVLQVCLPGGGEATRVQEVWLYRVERGQHAIELLRVLRFDLLITGVDVPDMTVWTLIQKIRNAWPWQKWVLVASSLEPESELVARTLGVLQILERVPKSQEIRQMAAGLRRRESGSLNVAAEAARHRAPGQTTSQFLPVGVRREPCF